MKRYVDKGKQRKWLKIAIYGVLIGILISTVVNAGWVRPKVVSVADGGLPSSDMYINFENNLNDEITLNVSNLRDNTLHVKGGRLWVITEDMVS